MSEANTLSGSTPSADVTYWRSLGQLENSPEFQDILRREFPEDIADAPDEVSRRGFLGVVAASVALAGLTSCRKPTTHIMPFSNRPEGYLPGMPTRYATTLSRGGYGIGVLVRSNDGRPTKIDGNELHPSSLGGSDSLLQGELLNLYDPGRSKVARGPRVDAAAEAAAHGGEHGAEAAETNLYAKFEKDWWEPLVKNQVSKQGSTLRFLVPPTASPVFEERKQKVLGVFPKARFHTWTPLHRDQELAGNRLAFGKAVDAQIDYEKADVVLSLDCDFLSLDGPNLRSARQWSKRRKHDAATIARLYAVESCYSTTGTAADHRFRMRSLDIPGAVMALAAELGVGVGGELGAALQASKGKTFQKNGKNWLPILAKDLQAHSGRCVVVAGPRQPAAVHALVHAINQALDAVNKVVTYTATPAAMATACVDDLATLKRDIEAGQVEVLVCVGTNPVYDAPADFKFGELLAKVPSTVHLGLYEDETGKLCSWHFPMTHELEAWGDARAFDGTVSLQQPLIAPLFGGLSPTEFLAWLSGDAVNDSHPFADEREGAAGLSLLRDYWKSKTEGIDFEAWWKRAVHDGVVADSPSAPETVQINLGGIASAVKGVAAATDGIEVAFRPDAKMWDGRNANNSWMQELPDPLTKLTWDNAALLSIATANSLGVGNGDLLNIAVDGGATLQAPAWILPGHADNSVTITLGYGRQLPADCKVAKGTGKNAYLLRSSTMQWQGPARVSKTDGRYPLVCTQDHGTMAGRAIVREATVEQNRRDPEWAPKMSPLDQSARLEHETEKDVTKSLWTERGYDKGAESQDPQVARSPYQWGMVIDLSACTGCSACVSACVAENNIPMVGKIQVSRNREMFWIRADRYFASRDTTYNGLLETADDPRVMNQPVPCMQCENAPCESVCPVAATTHSPDGLNDMVYNRCIGTRYCSNNCPYKVRRFNYLDYLGHSPETKKLAFNPDVTVRSRGVMEKCTYCVQRINGGRIQAKIQKRKVQDGEITPACAQSCPTQAITFGDILDPNTRVSKLKALGLNYGLLSDLNTLPRTTYLGRIRNPNPELS